MSDKEFEKQLLWVLLLGFAGFAVYQISREVDLKAALELYP